MSKKKQVETETIVRTVLTAEEYWKWRHFIHCMKIADLELAIAKLNAKVLHRDAEILHNKTLLYIKANVEPKAEELTEAKSSYQDYKKELEDAIGISLSGKMIDDFTYEVKELPEEPKAPAENKEGSNKPKEQE